MSDLMPTTDKLAGVRERIADAIADMRLSCADNLGAVTVLFDDVDSALASNIVEREIAPLVEALALARLAVNHHDAEEGCGTCHDLLPIIVAALARLEKP